MPGDRVIIVRILGLGNVTDPANPLTLTSRGTLAYLPADTIQGVVSAVSSTMSSDLPIFGNLGSDPSTQLSILATETTLKQIFSRGNSPLPDADGATVLTTAYITADPNPTIKVTDNSFIRIGDILRINGRAFEVGGLGANSFTATYAYGCTRAPIAMQNVAEGYQGIPVYLVWSGGVEYPSGGAEQRAITISSAPIGATTASQEKILFRGTVSKVSINTSAKADNVIVVDCQSMMGMAMKAPFIVPPGTLTFDGYLGGTYLDDGWFVDTTYISEVRAVLRSTPPPALVGELWDAQHTPYTTFAGKYQVRKGGYGGIMDIRGVNLDTGELIVSSSIVDPDNNDIQLSGFQLIFNDGLYRNPKNADRLDIDFANNPRNNSRDPDALANQDMPAFRSGISSEWVGEICFSSSRPATAIYDLLMGTVEGDSSGTLGSRAAGMSAWLPFPGQQSIDVGSLLEAFDETIIRSDFPYVQLYDSYTDTTSGDGKAVLPYVHDKVKTVGDVIETILKKFGAYMVYDAGVLRFGRWASVPAWPVKVDDDGLSSPDAIISFDRNNSLQTVTVEYPIAITPDKATVTKNPIANIDNVQTGAGKSLTIGPMRQGAAAGQQGLLDSFSLTQGFDLITRYSQAAVVLDISYLDSVYRLNVGDAVAIDCLYIPNAAGTMGVKHATGVVLKADRSWMAGFTKYSIFLANYLNAVQRVSMVACAGRVQVVSSPTDIRIEENIYTRPESRGDAPTSDGGAFEQAIAQSGVSSVYCILCDEYGTPYPLPAIKCISGAFDTLIFTATDFSVAIPGDIIILAPAPDQSGDLLECYDAFQADSGGYVAGALEYAYPWVR